MSYLTDLLGTLTPSGFSTWASAASDVGDGYLQPHAIGALGGTVGQSARVIATATITGGSVSPREVQRSFHVPCRAL